jgi:hypothetical protein
VLGAAERIAREMRAARHRRVAPPPSELDATAWHGSRVLLGEIRRAAKSYGMRIESVRWLDPRGGNAQIICRKVK